MLATRTFLFVGYSVSDDDFVELLRVLTAEMRGLRPHAYIVTLDRDAGDRLGGLGVTPIRTDAVYFMETLKKHLVATKDLLDDERIYSLLPTLLDIKDRNLDLFERFSLARHPEAVHCASYQDGMIHALDRVLAVAPSGRYSSYDRVAEIVRLYAGVRRDKLRGKQYHDVAYIDGYVNGLTLVVAPDEMRMAVPLYYVFGCRKDLRSATAYRREARRAETLHKTAYRQAKFLVETKLDGGKGMVFKHTTFLL